MGKTTNQDGFAEILVGSWYGSTFSSNGLGVPNVYLWDAHGGSSQHDGELGHAAKSL